MPALAGFRLLQSAAAVKLGQIPILISIRTSGWSDAVVKRFPSLAAVLAGWLGIPFASAEAAPLDSNQQAFFETKIRPVLAEQCYECHNAQKHKGGLALDSRVAWEQGGDSGPVIIR